MPLFGLDFVDVHDAGLVCVPRAFRGGNQDEPGSGVAGNRSQGVAELRSCFRIGTRDDVLGHVLRTRVGRRDSAIFGRRVVDVLQLGQREPEHGAALHVRVESVIPLAIKNCC